MKVFTEELHPGARQSCSNTPNCPLVLSRVLWHLLFSTVLLRAVMAGDTYPLDTVVTGDVTAALLPS